MFKSAEVVNGTVPRKGFKPYKGNVQIMNSVELAETLGSFKPYKGNVQIKLLHNYCFIPLVSNPIRAMFKFPPSRWKTGKGLGFKPYKGNVQISRPKSPTTARIVSNPIRAMFK